MRILRIALISATSMLHAWSADRFEMPPISYATATPDDAVTRLMRAIESNETTLEYNEQFGYLKSLLDVLDIPEESQILVFSKTSFQPHRISPETPRALYFNDDVYVGAVRNGDVLEISTADPKLGAVFYTLSQRRTAKPEFLRQQNNCLQCHASTLTGGYPGHVMRSVYADARGFPILRAGTRLTTQASPMKERWGGWYVTGSHGTMRHMGNSIAHEIGNDAALNMDAGANQFELPARVRKDVYLSEHSDIVALMVHGHQTHVHNLMTQANFETQFALEDQAVMDAALNRDSTILSESTRSRIANAGERLLESMLFADAPRLSGRIRGSSGFAAKFAEAGPRDSEGRSLRDFDLRTRLFRYPLSYLVYSPQFTGLPQAMKDYLYRRLWEILAAPEMVEFSHIRSSQRRAIREILVETLPDLPAYWNESD